MLEEYQTTASFDKLEKGSLPLGSCNVTLISMCECGWVWTPLPQASAEAWKDTNLITMVTPGKVPGI